MHPQHNSINLKFNPKVLYLNLEPSWFHVSEQYLPLEGVSEHGSPFEFVGGIPEFVLRVTELGGLSFDIKDLVLHLLIVKGLDCLPDNSAGERANLCWNIRHHNS